MGKKKAGAGKLLVVPPWVRCTEEVPPDHSPPRPGHRKPVDERMLRAGVAKLLEAAASEDGAEQLVGPWRALDVPQIARARRTLPAGKRGEEFYWPGRSAGLCDSRARRLDKNP
ncbi:hypothetical protein NDU88_005251 [Pleurodeles waltl]|uniref:Uncharacterized protein n=1 Tax=Pleurodeles waltl TaxID=8319 RepID=A0AAV7NLY7_PLEWA|nr:hypothetical protein NDU88_005251 [Pleurodeles waltl]